jgi:hypothetical protein
MIDDMQPPNEIVFFGLLFLLCAGHFDTPVTATPLCAAQARLEPRGAPCQLGTRKAAREEILPCA